MTEHTKNATVSATLKADSGYESTESHRVSPVQWGLIVSILNGDTRAATCVNALAGIDDPEAFMRDVRKIAKPSRGVLGSGITMTLAKHLKGGAG